MPVTPDRFPGQLEEDEGIYLAPQPTLPSFDGELRYVAGFGFRFREEGVTKSLTGTGLTPADHEALHTLTHEVVSNSYDEVTRNSSGRVISYVVWTNPSKTQKIRELLVTRDGQQRAAVLVTRQYDPLGALTATLTQTITRGPSGRVASITTVRT